MGRVSLGRVFVVLMLWVALGACTADEQSVEPASDSLSVAGSPPATDAQPVADAQAVTGAEQSQGSPAAGQVLFEETCAGCHPRSGRGNYLKRIPMTLLTRRSEYELKEWIRGSDEHREMPNFDTFSETELGDLAAYLKQEINK